MIEFIKKEAVLVISWILALISMLFVVPSKAYIDYIDFRTLALLFSLMIAVGGLRSENVFIYTAEKLLSRIKSRVGVQMILVLLCFFFSMLITNDVALITFVPFAIVVLRLAGLEDMIIKTVTLQTIAANLGSMLTPIGNPQNLYLFGIADMSAAEFIFMMLPYTLLAFVLLFISIIVSKNASADNINTEKKSIGRSVIVFTAMFALCFSVVGGAVDYKIVFFIILAVTAVKYRFLFKYVDFSLLATFIGFFIFIGNIGKIEAFTELIGSITDGNEILAAIISSQVISNVPSALLLSGFSKNYAALIIGTNIGGLGTLIASMASLISYKQIAAQYPNMKGKYIISFTLYNIVFLIFMLGLCIVIGAGRI